MVDAILVPTDGSDCADLAVEYAADLATRFEADAHVLSVVDSRTLSNVPLQQRITDERTEIVERIREDFAASDITATPAVRTAVPHEAILSYATDSEIDLIVMGTRGRTGIERYLLGSVAEKVVRLADVPVMTVKARDDGAVTYPFEDVLVPTDGSEGAAAAVAPAIDIAHTYDARLHALSVVDTRALGLDIRSDVVLDSLEQRARSAVESVEERAMNDGLASTETGIGYGAPSREIRSYVEDHGIDLVAMGTHGRSGIERVLLGSVAEKTVRTSPTPVLTVRGTDS